ncbi:MAG: replicative DNA helicase [uncultured marine virus]|nr:MAG: replicative DNA helicase [uncultured marine virus]
MEKLEITLLKNLIHNDDYARKVIPFIKLEYFEMRSEMILCQEIIDFIAKYNKCPTQEILDIEIQNRDDLTETEYKEIRDINQTLDKVETNTEWLVDATEKWCRDRAIYLALMSSIKIADGQDNNKGRDAIPHILSDALAVSFDNHIGHDYLEDYEARYESYHKKEEKIPFDLEFFDKITKGGVPNKTLNIALAGTGVGKSLFMCHFASSVLLQGKNVLYITLEMAEEKIAERIDANLLDVNIRDLTDLPRVIFENKVTKLAEKTQGQLIIKEYPTASAHAGHFKTLLNELTLKKSFKPDIIFIDYLNICASSRYSKLGNVNSYSYIKAIAEDLRGLAVEYNVPIISATQTTRSGFGSSDIDLTDTSESFGLPATADLMFALISTDELEGLNQIMVKQLKNRYNDPTINKRFVLGIDRAKMRLYDCEQNIGGDLIDSGQQTDTIQEGAKQMKDKFAKLQFT